MDQANYKAFNPKDEQRFYAELIYKYENKTRMISALKMAQLYEQLGKFDSTRDTQKIKFFHYFFHI
jgi:hypothetical protein